MISSSLAGLGKFDVCSKSGQNPKDSKRKIRNQSEKKRRDQFNQILKELEYLLYEGSRSNSGRVPSSHIRRRDKCSVLEDSLQFIQKIDVQQLNNNKNRHQSSLNAGTNSFTSRLVFNNGQLPPPPPPPASLSSITTVPSVFLQSSDIFTNCKDNHLRSSFSCAKSSDSDAATNLRGWRTSHVADNELFSMLEDSLDMFFLVVNATINAELIFASHGFGHECCGASCKRSTKECPCPNTLFDLLHDQDRPQFENLLQRCSETNLEFGVNEILFVECKLIRRLTLERSCECSGGRPEIPFERMRLCVSLRIISDRSRPNGLYLVCVCKPWQPRLLKEVHLQPDQLDAAQRSYMPSTPSFSSRHSIEWKFLWIEEHSFLYLGYPTFELLGNSTFDYYHWADMEPIANAYRQLLSGWDNQITTPKYRFLTKSQQWIWMQTSCTLVPGLSGRDQDTSAPANNPCNPDSHQANLIFCENHVLEAAFGPFARSPVALLRGEIRRSCPLVQDASKRKTFVKDNRSGLSSDSSSVYPSSTSSNCSSLQQINGNGGKFTSHQMGSNDRRGRANRKNIPSHGTPPSSSSTSQSASEESKCMGIAVGLENNMSTTFPVSSSVSSFATTSTASSSTTTSTSSTCSMSNSNLHPQPMEDYRMNSIMSRKFELEQEIQDKQLQLQRLSQQLQEYRNFSTVRAPMMSFD